MKRENKDIVKRKNQIELVSEIEKEYGTEIHVGDKFFSKYYGICEITDIFEKKNEYNDNSILKIKFKQLEEDDDEYEHEYEQSVREYFNDRHYKIESTINEFNEDVEKLANNEISGNDLLQKRFTNESLRESESKEIMFNSVDLLQKKKNEMIRQQNFLKSRYEAVYQILDRRKSDLYELSKMFEEQISKTRKLIYQIELYLGIKEEIHHLKVGVNASDNIKISFRQKILYMDVECGDPTDGGLDISTIDKFDDYILKYNDYFKKYNYEIFCPEEKCIVIFNLRKSDKEYDSGNAFIDSLLKDADKKTYIMIRNGENVYRIWSDIMIKNKLFPNEKEVADLIIESEKTSWESDKRDIENKIFSYKLNIILLQGLIERSDCFPNEKYTINLFEQETHEKNKVNFVYDADETKQLPSGIKTFGEWRDKLNEQTDEGSRIYFAGAKYADYVGYKYKNEEIRDRIFKQYFTNDYSYPGFPPSNIYEIKKEKNIKYTGKEQLYFMFIDEVRYKSEGVRDKRYSFLLNPTEDSRFYINFDAITLYDLDVLNFYLHTRIGREEYLQYMPMLLEIYKLRKQELEREGEFVKLVCSNCSLEFNEENDKVIRNKIVWWKLRNKFKRSLDKDNTKALRMIVKEINKLSK